MSLPPSAWGSIIVCVRLSYASNLHLKVHWAFVRAESLHASLRIHETLKNNMSLILESDRTAESVTGNCSHLVM